MAAVFSTTLFSTTTTRPAASVVAAAVSRGQWEAAPRGERSARASDGGQEMEE